MNIEKVKQKIQSYKDEVKELHPFLRNFFAYLPYTKHVEYTHGNREYGSDFILIQEDQILLKEKYIGVVVKSQKITQSDIENVERQINESFRMPKTIFNGQKKISLDTVWLITNNKITTNAKDKIREYFKDRNVTIIELDYLTNLVLNHYKDFLSNLTDNVFTIENNHIKSSGKFPSIDTKGKYLGYYENTFREQFIFIGNQKSQTASIYGGDLGWETEIELSMEMDKIDYLFSEDEILWISICFSNMSSRNIIETNAFFTKKLSYTS